MQGLKFSLLTLVLFVAVCGSGYALWVNWEPWEMTFSGPGYNEALSPGLSKRGRSPDGRTFIIADVDKTARIWDIRTGALIQTFEPATHQPTQMIFSPDGTQVLMWEDADILDIVSLWDVASGKRLRVLFNGLAGSSHMCEFSGDGRYVLVPGDNFYIGKPIHLKGNSELPFATGEHDFLGFSPDGKIAARQTAQGQLELWDTRSLKRTHVLPTPARGSPYQLEFSPDSRHVTAAEFPDKTLVWNCESGRVTASVPGRIYDTPPVAALSGVWSADGKRVLVLNEDDYHIVDAASGRILSSFPQQVNYRHAFFFLPDNLHLASDSSSWDPLGELNKQLSIFDESGNRKSALLYSSEGGFDVSPDGKIFLGCESTAWMLVTTKHKALRG